MKIAVVAGGTGGHIFPALATIEEMKVLSPESELLWITTQRSREKELAEEYSVTPLFLQVEGIKRSFSLQPIRAMFKFLRAFLIMFSHIKKAKIDRVVAFGGYVCAPVLLAARLRKVPFYLQEQNSVPGMVNRMFGKNAKKLFLGVPLAEGFSIDTISELSGTPVRKKENVNESFSFPFAYPECDKKVLICGGSQGAVSMNRVLMDAVKWMSENSVHVAWQSGVPGFDEVNDAFADTEMVEVISSMDDLYPYYEQADMLIGRSGASTISEAALFSLPTVLVPLPWSSENHQWFNAGYAEEAKWSIRLEQGNKTSEQLIEVMKEILENNTKYESMKNAAEKAARPDAALTVAREVLGC